jgi:hypothetical protein
LSFNTDGRLARSPRGAHAMQHNVTNNMTTNNTRIGIQPSPAGRATSFIPAAILACSALAPLAAPAQSAANLPITAGQKATAQQVAEAGVPLSELSPDAPDSYTVKRGDTLWAISGIFLRSPWNWPKLWGMNLAEIRNPHLIYPGQQLYLDRNNGRATLRTRQAAASGMPTETIRISPRTRYENLSDSALRTLPNHLIEPFLEEPLIVDENTLNNAPRIVATQEGRVLLSRGDRAYVRSSNNQPLTMAAGQPRDFRVFRNATPLKDPDSGTVIGYEAQYVGKAQLARGESTNQSIDKDGKAQSVPVPATIDIVRSKEEMRVGDRLLPEPPRQFANYVPRAPSVKYEARVVSVYGNAVRNAAQNQVVAINRGSKDGVEVGHVLAILLDGQQLVDRTDVAKPGIKLPDERNGLLMVFRTFDRLSYALVLETTDGVRVGDRLINPR